MKSSNYVIGYIWVMVQLSPHLWTQQSQPRTWNWTNHTKGNNTAYNSIFTVYTCSTVLVIDTLGKIYMDQTNSM